MSNETEKTKSTGKGGVKVVIVIAAVVILALVGVIIWLVMSKDSEEQQEKRNVVVTKENVEEVVDQMATEAYVEPGYYEASMTNEWHFKTGNAVSEDAFIENKETNTNDVYFDVFLVDDEENPILKSPVIPRGGELKNIALDTPLDKGTYDCVLVYHLVDENQKDVSTLRVAIKVIIEK